MNNRTEQFISRRVHSICSQCIVVYIHTNNSYTANKHNEKERKEKEGKERKKEKESAQLLTV